MGVWWESCEDEMKCCIAIPMKVPHTWKYALDHPPMVAFRRVVHIVSHRVIPRTIAFEPPHPHASHQPHTLAVTALVASTSIRFA